MGALKLIESIAQHFYTRFTPAGYGMEGMPRDGATESKNAVVIRSVEVGVFAAAAALLGAATGEPFTRSESVALGIGQPQLGTTPP
jgi:NitT/TauT family transport system substrate-binding protein